MRPCQLRAGKHAKRTCCIRICRETSVREHSRPRTPASRRRPTAADRCPGYSASSKRVKPPDGSKTSETIPMLRFGSETGKLTRRRVCSTVIPTANRGTRSLRSPIANTAGARGFQWKSTLFPHLLPGANPQRNHSLYQASREFAVGIRKIITRC